MQLNIQLVKGLIFITIFVLSTKYSATQTIFPPDTNSIAFWLSAESNVSYDPVTFKVSSWESSLSDANAFTQASGPLQPIYIEENQSINGMPSLFFGGSPPSTNIQYSSLLRPSNLVLKNGYSILVLINRESLTTPSTQYFVGGAASGLSIGGSNSNRTQIVGHGKVTHGDFIDNKEFQIIHFSPSNIFLNREDITNTNVTVDSLSIDRIGVSSAITSLYHFGNMVEIIAYDRILSESEYFEVVDYFQAKYFPPLHLGPDRNSLCQDLDAYQPWFTSYLWNTGDTTPQISLSSPGTYHVTVTDVFGNVSADTVLFDFPFTPNFNLESPNYFCNQDSVLLDITTSNPTQVFSWSNGKLGTGIYENTNDTLTLSISDTSSCTLTLANIQTRLDSIIDKRIFLSNDTSFCSGNPLQAYDQVNFSPSYLWSTGNTSPSIAIDTSGLYSLTITDSLGCFIQDSINITINGSAPNTNFESLDTVCQFSAITLQNISQSTDNSNIISSNWDISNGDSFSTENLNYTFNDTGIFTVSLVSYTDSGCSSTQTKDMLVNIRPVSDFMVSTSVLCSGSPVSFTNNSSTATGSIAAVKWFFTPQDSSTAANPSFSFPSGDLYSIDLIAINDVNCADTSTQSITVLQAPEANFLYQNQCTESTFSFIDNSLGNISQWNWNFGNGLSSTSVNPTTVYTQNGDYPLTLTVTDVFGCSHDTSTIILPYTKPSFTLNNTLPCSNAEVKVYIENTNVPSLTYEWETNYDYQFLFDSVISIETRELLTAIEGFVVASTAEGCVTEDSLRVELLPMSPTSFTLNPAFGQPPFDINALNTTDDSLLSQTWLLNQNIFSSDDSVTLTIQDTGLIEIKLITQNNLGCIDSTEKTFFSGESVYDLALNNTTLLYSADSLTYKTEASVQNQSLLPVYYFEILTQIVNNDFSTLFIWESSTPLNPGEDTTILIPTVFNHNATDLEPFSLCNKVQNPNQNKDFNSQNNTDCYAKLASPVLTNLYPNPTTDVLVVEILSNKEQEVELSIHNLNGLLINSYAKALSIGINHLNLNLAHLNAGKYALSFTLDGITQQMVFVKLNQE